MPERLTSTVKSPPRARPVDEHAVELSDHLARMLAHADAIVDEWARFGAQVQGRLSAQLGELEQAFGEGARAAATKVRAELAGAIEAGASERFDRALGDRLAAVRAELDRVARELRGASAAAAARDAQARRTWIAVLVANGLIAIAIAVLWFRGPARSAALAPPDAAIAPAMPAMIAPPDAALPDAAPPDATIVDAGPADAAPARPPARPHRGAAR